MKWVTDGEKRIWNTNSNQRVNVFSTQKDSTIGKGSKQSVPSGSNQVASKSVEKHLNIIIKKNEKYIIFAR